MYRSTVSIEDVLDIVGLLLVYVACALYISILINLVAAIGTFLFGVVLLRYKNTHFRKETRTPPYFYCDGCGAIHSETEEHEWRGYRMCQSCMRDTDAQRKFAVRFPLWFKKLNR